MGWQRIGVTVHLKSALHLGQAPQGAGEYLFTQRHIPGAALRGALAEVLVRDCAREKAKCSPNECPPETRDECLFYQLMGEPGHLRFEPAYPVVGTGYSFPFPLTARTCKLKEGFPEKITPTEQEKHHGVFDTLVSQFVFEQMLDDGRKVPFIYRSLCPRCGGGVKEATGCYGWFTDNDVPLPIPKIDKNIVRTTHTAINRTRGVAEDAMLYTIEAIQKGTTFRGTLWVACDVNGTVEATLTNITRLGRGTSRGRGRVEVTPHSEPDLPNLEDRIQALTACIKKERQFYYAVAGQSEEYQPDDAHYFTLDLLSPAVLGDGVTADLLLTPERLGLPKGVEPKRRWVTPEHVGGWWTVAGLPHPTALAAAVGSVYLYRVGREVMTLNALAGRLREIQAQGIGRERDRGYGAVLPCAPFHTWTEEKAR